MKSIGRLFSALFFSPSHFFLALPWTALHNAAHRVSE
jgi:hypothetical protein